MSLTALHAIAIAAAGLAAGTINTVVGSGTLITFPVLIALGYPPVTANVSNTIGLVPGAVTGAYGFRAELSGQGRRTRILAVASVTGGVLGAIALLTLPASAFKAIVPAFIGLALVLVVAQPWVDRALAHRRADAGRERSEYGGRGALAGTLAAGIYGGYFGAAQGIMLLAVLGLTLDESLSRVNAVKVVLAGLVNLVSGLLFALVAHVAWDVAAVIAAGSTVGGVLGARIGRRLDPRALRLLVVVVGVSAIVRLVS